MDGFVKIRMVDIAIDFSRGVVALGSGRSGQRQRCKQTMANRLRDGVLLAVGIGIGAVASRFLQQRPSSATDEDPTPQTTPPTPLPPIPMKL